jgi:uncharacterized protein YecE (DUF72 family)
MENPNEEIIKPGQVCFGTCGYTDQTLLKCGRFYPATAKTSLDRLKFYSNTYPCVEIDTTTYAIPTPEVTQRWATSTTTPFKLHVKAFGLFTAGSVSIASLPVHVRSMLPPYISSSSSHIKESDLPKAALDACWSAFQNCLQTLYLSEKLGIIIFQFHITFKPSTANLDKIITIRTQRLAAKYKMAVEFRCRYWFTLPEWSTRLETLGAHGIAIISSDELQHETFQKDRDQIGLLPGHVKKILPICNIITNREWHYIRLHRRHGGTMERSLTREEVSAWGERLSYLGQHINGPIYFLVGTDWEDVPMKNIDALNQVLPEHQRVEWKKMMMIAMRRNAAGGGGGGMFKYLLSNNKTTGSGDGGSGKRRQGIDDVDDDDDEKQQVKDTHPTSQVDYDDGQQQQQKKKTKGIAQYFLGNSSHNTKT